MEFPNRLHVFFIFFLSSIFLSFGQGRAHTVTFYFRNKCPFTVWPATAPNAGQPIIADGGFTLPSGQTQRVIAPSSWTGRFWARTGCNFGPNQQQPACETGDCGGKLACKGLIGTPPATLVEVTLQEDKSKPNFYDISLVDGFNLPISVNSKQPISPKCAIGSCEKDLNKICPDELKVLNGNGEVVACRSACLAFGLDSFCCRNAYGSPETCKPSLYSRMFKEACPSYYSFAFDSPPPLASCSARELVITFCPAGWGSGDAAATARDDM